MTAYLLAVSVGPVQGFIAAARRTRDLWMGSTILSEVAKAVARELRTQHGADLIFPAPEDPDADLAPLTRERGGREPQAEFNVANIILCRVSEVANSAAIADDVRRAANVRWREFADEAYEASKDDIITDRWERQLGADDVVEVYAAWAPCAEPGGYAEARRRVMRLLAGRKACREFPPAPGDDAGIPKSSLDGARPSVLRTWSESERDPLRNQRRPSGLWARPGEQLDIIGVTKRAEYGHDTIRYISVSRVAADPWLRGIRATANESNQPDVRAFLDELEIACERLADLKALRKRTGADFEKFPFLEEFSFEGTAVYRSRHREILEDCPYDPERQGLGREEFVVQLKARIDRLGDAVRRLEKRFGEPNPYLAVLSADGDHVGATLSAIRTSEGHSAFSLRQSVFAREARRIVRKHRGATVYAGGDDVLAFVPVNECLDCARRLHERFHELLLDVVPDDFVREHGPPTLSVGIAVGHFMAPLEDLLNFARAAEKQAKGDDRNGLAIALHPRGGASFTVREQWRDGEQATGSLDRRILRWAGLVTRRQLSNKAAYDLREIAQDYEHWPRGDDDQRGALGWAISRDAARILARKRGAGGEAPGDELKPLLEKAVDATTLRAVAEELLVAQWIAQAMDQAAGARGQAGEGAES